ncbi:MAG TPA: hypothetical protein VFN56_04010 [Candidatus Saccharimonadales bacterium]|nr:hypothetical protein [Candidatus Saccharimonadales bacterium]
MKTIHNNEHGTTGIIALLLVVIVVLIGAVGWLTYTNHKKSAPIKVSTTHTVSPVTTPASTPVPLTNDQIYQEVATQLRLTRSSVLSFRIFGQDKVQYNTTESGNTYAYKTAGTWKIAATDVQSVLVCSTLASVPDQYKPPCADTNSTSAPIHFANADNTSSNYPIASAVSYIGQ